MMASNADFVQYIVDQCSGAGEIAVKKMMGDYCIYCDGILFGLICDNNLYIKPTEEGATQLKEVILRPPYPGAKPHFYINEIDNRDYLTAILRATIPALLKSKPKSKPKPKSTPTPTPKPKSKPTP
jgi:TfoX/Sxy family transcriptional regulator of competence genes